MLTPIKVRGKKRRQNGLMSTSKHATNQHRIIGYSPKLPKSPNFSSLSELHPVVSPKKSKKPTPFQHLSALEKLPTELLETILFLSSNISLPRASPIIGVKLSSKHVYIHTILSVFGPTWEDRYGRVQRTPYTQDSREWSESSVAGDPSVQTLVVRYRWATLDLLRKAEELWLRDVLPFNLELVELPGQQPPWRNLQMLTFEELHAIEFYHELDDARWLLQKRFYPQPTRWFGKTDDVKFEEDYANFQTAMEINKVKAFEKTFLPPYFRWEGLLKVHPLLEVPDCLLQGPWTDQMVKHLFYFVRAGARVDGLRTTNSEVAHRGFRGAIKDGRLDVMYLLLCLGINKDFRDTTILEWAVQNAGGNRLHVVATVFDMMKWTPYRASCHVRNHMFSRVVAAVQEICRNEEQRTTEMNWLEEFSAYWLSFPDALPETDKICRGKDK